MHIEHAHIPVQTWLADAEVRLVPVALETAVDNLPALSFYKRHGYAVVKTWPRYYSNGVDALVMRKELAPRG